MVKTDVALSGTGEKGLTCCIRSLTFLAPVSITDLNPELKNLKKYMVGFPWKLTMLHDGQFLAGITGTEWRIPKMVSQHKANSTSIEGLLYYTYNRVPEWLSLRPSWLPPPHLQQASVSPPVV